MRAYLAGFLSGFGAAVMVAVVIAASIKSAGGTFGMRCAAEHPTKSTEYEECVRMLARGEVKP